MGQEARKQLELWRQVVQQQGGLVRQGQAERQQQIAGRWEF